ncbi:pentatricopeptide repeat-containing protein At2g22410, mitochondrial-like [Telopea speciosissima]|uniref:pentatricopeptide repeat-containing protein At2g22410, mitochondrial-like n=1 Tax=Telopea speciosissima TaxID=54955 RepID=UPI001CC80C77|nr:pentatricopeptide repeat-containing protein At2g22410, mitochondrial-like [Telopea speciosissima]
MLKTILNQSMMCGRLDFILQQLKRSTTNHKQLAQIFAQTITAGLIHTTLTWNCVIRAYSKSSTPFYAILIYNYFVTANSVSPDSHTYPALIKACTHLVSISKGKEIHAHVTKIGLDSDVYVQNSLIHFYGSTALIQEARQVFDIMPQRDSASWNSLLASYSKSPGLQFEALVLFKAMVFDGVQADAVTLVILLLACTQVGVMEYGRGIHAFLVKRGIRCSLNLENALLSIYAKGGDMDMAFRFYLAMKDRRDVVSHTILINGYVESGLVDLARGIFDLMVVKDLVSWNSMIHGYVKAKRPRDALEIFKKMEMESVKADETTIVGLLSAAASLCDLQFGRLVHQFVLQLDIRIDSFVGTALIDMYAKCGSFEDAMLTFFKIGYRDTFAWTAVITGLANCGHGSKALTLFEQMEKEGIEPNETTFVAALTACSRSGLLEEGCLLFDRMTGVYNMKPKVEHLGCLIDLFSRAGLLYQAEDLTRTLPTEERVIAYKTILGACMNYSEIDLGKKVAEELITLGPQSHGVYILLANFYAMAGQWENVVEIRKLMKKLDMRKDVGISFIEAYR